MILKLAALIYVTVVAITEYKVLRNKGRENALEWSKTTMMMSIITSGLLPGTYWFSDGDVRKYCILGVPIVLWNILKCATCTKYNNGLLDLLISALANIVQIGCTLFFIKILIGG